MLRDLALLERQGAVEGFFNNTENAAQLGGLVEGIRDAMMDYQVCASNSSSRRLSYFFQTSLQQGIYNKQQDIDNKARVIMVGLVPSPLTPTV